MYLLIRLSLSLPTVGFIERRLYCKYSKHLTTHSIVDADADVKPLLGWMKSRSYLFLSYPSPMITYDKKDPASIRNAHRDKKMLPCSVWHLWGPLMMFEVKIRKVAGTSVHTQEVFWDGRSVVPLKVALIDNKVEIDELVHTSMANSSPLLFIPIFHPSTQLPGQG